MSIDKHEIHIQSTTDFQGIARIQPLTVPLMSKCVDACVGDNAQYLHMYAYTLAIYLYLND